MLYNKVYAKDEIQSKRAVGDVSELCPIRITRTQETSVSFQLSHLSFDSVLSEH